MRMAVGLEDRLGLDGDQCMCDILTLVSKPIKLFYCIVLSANKNPRAISSINKIVSKL